MKKIKKEQLRVLQEQILLLKKNRHLDAELKPLEGKLSKNSLNSSKPFSSGLERRQILEITEPKVWITEYQVESKDCTRCGYMTSACFSEGITYMTQYGQRAKSLIVYINQYQFVLFERASEFFNAVYGQKVSPAMIVHAIEVLGCRLGQLNIEVKETRSKAHCDETGMSITGKKHWVYTVHPRAGSLCHARKAGGGFKFSDHTTFILSINAHGHSMKNLNSPDKQIQLACCINKLRLAFSESISVTELGPRICPQSQQVN